MFLIEVLPRLWRSFFVYFKPAGQRRRFFFVLLTVLTCAGGDFDSLGCMCRQTSAQWQQLLRQNVPAVRDMNLKVDESTIHEELNLAWAGAQHTHVCMSYTECHTIAYILALYALILDSSPQAALA